MISSELQQGLAGIVKGEMRFNEPMSGQTTIKIGGPADVWVEPADASDLMAVVRFADENNIHRMVFGNGSNTLVRDKGIRGIVISLSRFNGISEAGSCEVAVGAGVQLPHIIGWSVERSLSGLEPLAGIPGTVGGAVIMNAGVKEGTIGGVVRSLKYVSRRKIITAGREELEFGYRRLKLPKGAVIIEATLSLKPDDRHEIEARINRRKRQRGETQPLLWPSLGSVFRNPEHAKAWQLIDDAGLRGVRVGGARVSNEHANWIINEGNATARDVEILIKMIRERVKEKSGITLEPEIIIVGDE